jgi:hypothetical protein
MRREISAQARVGNMTTLFYEIIAEFFYANCRRRPGNSVVAELLDVREGVGTPRPLTCEHGRFACTCVDVFCDCTAGLALA